MIEIISKLMTAKLWLQITVELNTHLISFPPLNIRTGFFIFCQNVWLSQPPTVTELEGFFEVDYRGLENKAP